MCFHGGRGYKVWEEPMNNEYWRMNELERMLIDEKNESKQEQLTSRNCLIVNSRARNINFNDNETMK